MNEGKVLNPQHNSPSEQAGEEEGDRPGLPSSETPAALQQEVERLRKDLAALRGLGQIVMEGSDPVIIEDLTGCIVEINGEAEQVYGWSRDELIGQPVEWLVPLEQHQQASELRARCYREAVVRNVEGLRCNKQGKSHPVLLTLLLLTDGDGMPAGIATIARNISRQKEAEAAFRESEQRLQLALEGGQMGVWQWNLGSTVSWSGRMYELFGLPVQDGEIKVDDIWRRYHPDDLDENQRLIRKLLEQGGELQQEFRVIRPNGQLCWLKSIGRLFQDEQGRPLYLAGITYDITRRKRTELERERLLTELATEQAQLKELNERLEEQVELRTKQVRALASALALAEQQERSRISRTLYDDLQQLLFSQLIRLQILSFQFSAEESSALGQELYHITKAIEEAIDITRRLVVELAPPVLEWDKLEEALQWLITHMEEIYNLKTHLSSQEQDRLRSSTIQVLLLQLVRRLLFNIVQHAGVDQAYIDLRQEAEATIIQVKDEGQGFNVEQIRSQQKKQLGLGLFNVEGWLRLVGGRLEIDSSPGQGTRMTIIAPLEEL
jgi:PAS domain S-box-containing protein